MGKRDQKKLLNLIIVLIIILGSYIYTNYFEKEDINKSTTSVEQTINVSSDNLKIYFLDVGQADSILISKGNEYALIDAGNNEDGPLLVEYFKSLGITKFNYVIGTHAHEDHIGGMDDIINNFSIEKFYMPDAITTTKTFEDVLDALDAHQVKFETPKINDEFSLNDATFCVLHVGTNKNDLIICEL